MLPPVAENPRLTIESGIRRGSGKRLVLEANLRTANDLEVLDRDSVAGRQPHLTCDCAFGEDECAYRALCDVDERRVTTRMRCEVNFGERDPCGAAVTVDGKVDEFIVRARLSRLRDESGGQLPITALARDVVDPVTGEDNIVNQQPRSTSGPSYTATKHRSMFIPVTREQVIV